MNEFVTVQCLKLQMQNTAASIPIGRRPARRMACYGTCSSCCGVLLIPLMLLNLSHTLDAAVYLSTGISSDPPNVSGCF
jgi:hypothetical protein